MKIGPECAIIISMDDHQKTILIIDDDKNLREILSVKLQGSGFRVEEAQDGQSGIAKARELKPDLILLDVRMPGMTGIETLSNMKQDKDLAGLRVIFLTNLGEANEQDSWVDDKFAKDAGALGHIKKTDDLDKIISKVKEAVAVS